LIQNKTQREGQYLDKGNERKGINLSTISREEERECTQTLYVYGTILLVSRMVEFRTTETIRK
jgi:hypothetical protein